MGCGGRRSGSWGPARLPGLSCSRRRIAISRENAAEFPAPLGRAILSRPVPFSKTPCALCGDLDHLARRAELAQTHGCRVRPSGLGLVVSTPPAPTTSSEWVGELAVSVRGDGGGICHGVMSTGPHTSSESCHGKGGCWLCSRETRYILQSLLLDCSAALD